MSGSTKAKFVGVCSTGKAKPGRVPFVESPPGSPSRSTVNHGKKDKLEAIITREERKAKKERVGHVLVQKLANKLGVKNTPIISFYIEEFLETHETITSDDIDGLEIDMRKAIKASVDTATLKQISVQNSNAAEMKQKEQQEKVQQKAEQEQKEKKERDMKPPPGSEWLTIMTYKTVLADEKHDAEQKKLADDKVQLKRDLDAQITASKRMEEYQGWSYNKIDEQYNAHVVSDVQKFHEQEAAKAAEVKAKNRKQFDIQQQQIADQRRRAAAQEEYDQAETRKNLQFAKEDLEREEEKHRRIKQKESEVRKVVEEENERNRRLQDEMKAKIAAEDSRLMAEYAAKLAREEKAREDAFQKKMDDMQSMGSKYENEGAGKVAREERIAEEQRLLREQKIKEDRDLANEIKKQQDARNRTKLDLTENARQIAAKKARAEMEQKSENEYLEKFNRDAEAYKKEVKDSYWTEKQKKANYKLTLNKQKQDAQKFDKNLMGCSKEEWELNKPVFDSIKNDANMRSRVMHRMRMDKK